MFDLAAINLNQQKISSPETDWKSIAGKINTIVIQKNDSVIFKREFNLNLPSSADSFNCLFRKWINHSAGINIEAEQQFLFFDTETTGLSGSNTYIFLSGFLRNTPTGYKVTQYFLPDPAFEADFLQLVSEEFSENTLLITYNGKTFDIPLFLSRCTYYNLPLPHTRFHFDLLFTTRRFFRDFVRDCSLKVIEETVLSETRDADSDIPGILVPLAYFDYLSGKQTSEIKKVIYHNECDLKNMVLLFQAINRIFDEDDDRYLLQLGKISEEMKDFHHTIRLYEKICDYSSEGRQRLSMIFKKMKNLPESIRLWTNDAQNGQLYAMQQLAIYEEHHNKDILQALHWTNKALRLLFSEHPQMVKLTDNFMLREKRLKKKLLKTSE